MRTWGQGHQFCSLFQWANCRSQFATRAPVNRDAHLAPNVLHHDRIFDICELARLISCLGWSPASNSDAGGHSLEGEGTGGWMPRSCHPTARPHCHLLAPVGPSKPPFSTRYGSKKAQYLACKVSPPVNEASRFGEYCGILTFVRCSCPLALSHQSLWQLPGQAAHLFEVSPYCTIERSGSLLPSHLSLCIAPYSRAFYYSPLQLHRYSFITLRAAGLTPEFR